MMEHRKYRNAKDVSISEMLSSSGFTDDRITKVQVSEKALTKTRVFQSAVVFLVMSVIGGMFFSIVPLYAMGQAAGVAAPVADYWKSLPDELGEMAIAQKNTLYDKNGNVFAQVWSENRTELQSLDQISDYAKNGLIATEDKTFYNHHGIDLKGTARAALSGSGGGSGITQQLVKNLQFYNLAGKDKKEAAVESTISRKIQELKYALKYEKEHTKDEILLAYFNTVAFGGPNTYSIETAAQYFFGKSAKDLSLAESAVLVGSVQNPTFYNLNKPENKDAYKSRQKIVLDRMVAEKFVTQEEADKAYNEELNLVFKQGSSGNCTSSAYPFYCEYVMQYLSSSPRLGETQEERDAVIQKGGLQIHTYLDPNAMSIVENQLKTDYGTTNRLVSPTAVVEPGTGGVLAMASNRDYGEGEGQTTINLPLHPTGTGSVYKMFTLAAALRNGFKEKDLEFSSRCPLYDNRFDMPPGGVKNSSSCALQGGFMDYKKATALSSNTWFTELEIKVGVDKVKEFSSEVGLSAPDSISSRSISYTLGVTENSTVSMAAAFATFANSGIYCPPTPVSSYEYSDGSQPAVPETYDPSQDSCRRVLSPHDAGIVLKAMRANVSGEIPNAFGLDFANKYETAAKSGTNQLYNSTWAVLSGNFSVFSNLYNPTEINDGIDYARYRGRSTRWFDHVIGYSGRDIMNQLLDSEGFKPLAFDSSDTSFKEVPVEKKAYFTVPSVKGMTAEEALATLKPLGIKSYVSKTRKTSPSGYPDGVIVEQSIDPGTQLPVGSKKELILYQN